jgi:hypothetical protein
MNPTRRVEQLIALATDPAASEEEARTAALQAARSIRQNGLKVTTEEEWEAAQQERYYTSRAVTPQSHQMGMGTPTLPPRPRAPVRRALSVPEDRRGGAHVVNLEFRDDVPQEKREQAFSTALLALLRK